MWNELCQIDKDQRGSQVVNSLHVATGRMSHSPSKQNANHHYLDLLGAEKLYLGLSSVNIDLYLFDAFLLVLRHLSLFK